MLVRLEPICRDVRMKKATFLCVPLGTCKTFSLYSNVVLFQSEFEEKLPAAQKTRQGHQGFWYVFTYMYWLRMTLV
jgi:predicted metal-binding transcription factor (methanogenesis marker protein 9)